jgi:hypothetical protein
VVPRDLWTGFGLDDWIYWNIYTVLGTIGNYSAIADLHTLQLTVTHSLDFSVFTSRILATDFITVSLSLQITHEVSILQPNSFLAIILQMLIQKTRLSLIPVLQSSYRVRLASRNSTQFYTGATSQSQSYVTTDGQSASLSWNKAPIWGLRQGFYYCQTVAGLLMWGALYNGRTGLPFTVAAGPRQRSHSWVPVPRDSCPYVTASDSRLPQPGGPGSRIYIPQERGGPVILPGTGSPRRLLRLSGPQWRYSKPPPRAVAATSFGTLLYNHFARTTPKTLCLFLERCVYNVVA